MMINKLKVYLAIRRVFYKSKDYFTKLILAKNYYINEQCFLISAIAILSLSSFYITTKILWEEFANEQKDRIDSLIKGPLTEVINDIEKAKIILDSIQSTYVKSNKNTNYNFDLTIYKELKTFKIFKNYQISLEKNAGLIEGITHNKDIFDILIISKVIDIRYALLLKVDYQEIIEQLSSRINNENILYTLYNKHDEMILSNTPSHVNKAPLIYLDQIFKNGMRLVVWINNQKILAEQVKQRNIGLLISISFLLSILLFYFACKAFLKKRLLKNYVEEVEILKASLTKINSENYALNDNIENIKIASKAQYDFDFIMLNGIKAILARTNKIINNQITIISEYKIPEETIPLLKIIGSNIERLYNFQIIVEKPTKINIRLTLENAIFYWMLEIKRKSLQVNLECNISETSISISKATFIQVIYSILGMVIKSLPKKKYINISVNLNTEEELYVEIKDNGFGLTLEKVAQYSKIQEENKKFILSWLQLTSLLNELKVKFTITSNTGKGNLIALAIPIYQLKQLTNKSNVVNLSNFKKKQ